MKLYELAESYHRIEALFDEEGADWEKALDEITEDFNTKAESVAKMVREFEAEAKIYSDKASAATNKARSLKAYLQANMLATGIQNVKGQLLNIFLQKSPPSCNIIDESQIPDEYIRVIPEQKEPDRKAIIEAHKKGITVPGVEIIKDNRYILIK